eukprot:m51a1_g1943 hypothetical protein (505) ;mRNA; r:941007-943041
MRGPWVRWVLLGCAFVQLFFLAAVLFGWPALLLLLKHEGQYSEVCPPAAAAADDYDDDGLRSSSSSSGSGAGAGVLCPAQEVRLNLIFTVAFFVNGIANLEGLVVDICCVTGSALLAVADSRTFDAFIPGLAVMALGGPAIYFSCFHLCNLWTARRNTVIAAFSGLWILGNFVLVVVQELYFRLGVSRRASFLGLTAFAFVLFAVSVLFLVPSKPYEQGDEPVIEPFWRSRARRSGHVKLEDAEASPAAERRAEKPRLLAQLLTVRFLVALVFIVTVSPFIAFSIGTAELRLKQLGDTGVYVKLFTMLSALGVAFIPLIGAVMDRWGVKAYAVVAVLLVETQYALSLVPSLQTQVVGFLLFAWCRVSMGATTATYVKTEFGLANFGALTGFLWLRTRRAAQVSGVLGMAQNPLLSYVLKHMGGDFTPVVAAFMALALVGLAMPAYLWALWLAQRRRAGAQAEAPLMSPHEHEAELADRTGSQDNVDNVDNVDIEAETRATPQSP